MVICQEYLMSLLCSRKISNMIKHKIILTIAAVATWFSLKAQTYSPVKWYYTITTLNNTEAIVYIHARIDLGWHIYSQNVPAGGPVKTEIEFYPSKDYELIGKPIEPKPIILYYDVFNMNVGYFENEVTFKQKIKILTKGSKINGFIEYMADNDFMSIPPDETRFSITL